MTMRSEALITARYIFPPEGRMLQTWADTIKGALSVPGPSELDREIAVVFPRDDPNPRTASPRAGLKLAASDGVAVRIAQKRSLASVATPGPTRWPVTGRPKRVDNAVASIFLGVPQLVNGPAIFFGFAPRSQRCIGSSYRKNTTIETPIISGT